MILTIYRAAGSMGGVPVGKSLRDEAYAQDLELRLMAALLLSVSALKSCRMKLNKIGESYIA